MVAFVVDHHSCTSSIRVPWLFLNAGEKLLVLNVSLKSRPVKLMARGPELSITGDFFLHFLSHVANDLNRRGADVKAFDCVTRSK